MCVPWVLIIFPPPGQAPKTGTRVWHLTPLLVTVTASQSSRDLHFTGPFPQSCVEVGFEEKEAGSKRPVRLLAVVQVSYDGPNLAMLVATQEGRINQHAQITVYSEWRHGMEEEEEVELSRVTPGLLVWCSQYEKENAGGRATLGRKVCSIFNMLSLRHQWVTST